MAHGDSLLQRRTVRRHRAVQRRHQLRHRVVAMPALPQLHRRLQQLLPRRGLSAQFLHQPQYVALAERNLTTHPRLVVAQLGGQLVVFQLHRHRQAPLQR